ncbi:hypothetical protein [Spiroplasma endosymbiont of Panorpa germanica]|uniref:hypothetical protein n=1 Tax=Spiroplasma endosymbiont of Panorpa germanica TaxID=3066314 RepID=UPI0030CE01C4
MLLSEIGKNNLKSLVEYYCEELREIFPMDQKINRELANLLKEIDEKHLKENLEDIIILISDSVEKIESLANKVDIKSEQDMKDFMKTLVFSRVVKKNLDSAVSCISKIKYLGSNSEVENLDISTVNNSFAISLLKNNISSLIRTFDKFVDKNEKPEQFRFFEECLIDILESNNLNDIIKATKKLLLANEKFLAIANSKIELKVSEDKSNFDNLTFLTISTARVISESSSFVLTTSIIQDIFKQIG